MSSCRPPAYAAPTVSGRSTAPGSCRLDGALQADEPSDQLIFRQITACSADRNASPASHALAAASRYEASVSGDNAVSAVLRQRELKLEERNRSRCRRYGAAYVERVLLSVVFDRDEGRCWLCGGPTLLEPPKGGLALGHSGVPQPLPHPELATLDHVVPLSERGDHSYANVRLAHYACNAATRRPPADDLRRLISFLRTSWEENSVTARRLDELDLSAISVRVSGGSRRQGHLAAQDEDVWRPACTPDDTHAFVHTTRSLGPPTCKLCRSIFLSGSNGTARKGG